jgi:hypothetical protein
MTERDLSKILTPLEPGSKAQTARTVAECLRIAKELAMTHGALTVERLLAMLAEDCGMIINRPGSLEGSGMANLLASHGYDLGE